MPYAYFVETLREGKILSEAATLLIDGQTNIDGSDRWYRIDVFQGPFDETFDQPRLALVNEFKRLPFKGVDATIEQLEDELGDKRVMAVGDDEEFTLPSGIDGERIVAPLKQWLGDLAIMCGGDVQLSGQLEEIIIKKITRRLKQIALADRDVVKLYSNKNPVRITRPRYADVIPITDAPSSEVELREVGSTVVATEATEDLISA